jgi:hypothetical protein
MKWTKTKAVFNEIGSLAAVPVNVRGLKSHRKSIQLRVEAAHGALIPIRAENRLSEPGISDAPNLDLHRVDVQTDSGEQCGVNARRKVVRQDSTCKFGYELGVGLKLSLQRGGEAPRHAPKLSHRWVGIARAWT